jgi:hypothetical protein
MKLYYYQTTDGTANFGDDLNEMIWSAYIPELLDQDDSKLLIGIGTLLNDFIPEKGDKIVFGSGVGYGKTLPRLNDQWQFYAVRGPLSALSLGLPPETAVVDPGVLIRRLYQANEPKLYKFSYMPHFHIAQGRGAWVWLHRSTLVCRKSDEGAQPNRSAVGRSHARGHRGRRHPGALGSHPVFPMDSALQMAGLVAFTENSLSASYGVQSGRNPLPENFGVETTQP